MSVSVNVLNPVSVSDYLKPCPLFAPLLIELLPKTLCQLKRYQYRRKYFIAGVSNAPAFLTYETKIAKHFILSQI